MLSTHMPDLPCLNQDRVFVPESKNTAIHVCNRIPWNHKGKCQCKCGHEWEDNHNVY